MWQAFWQWKSYSPGLSATKSGTRLPMCASTGAVSLTAASGAVANLEEVAVKVQGVRHRTLVLEDEPHPLVLGGSYLRSGILPLYPRFRERVRQTQTLPEKFRNFRSFC